MGRDLEIAPTKAGARCVPYGISIAAEMLGIANGGQGTYYRLRISIALPIRSLDLFGRLIPFPSLPHSLSRVAFSNANSGQEPTQVRCGNFGMTSAPIVLYRQRSEVAN